MSLLPVYLPTCLCVCLPACCHRFVALDLVLDLPRGPARACQLRPAQEAQPGRVCHSRGREAPRDRMPALPGLKAVCNRSTH